MKTKHKLLCAMALTIGAGSASSAHAQHSDISPRVEAGRILADSHDDATGIVVPNQRVFGYDFQEDAGDPYFAGDPGFSASAGSGLPGGSQLLFNIPSGTAFGLPSNLAYWSGAGEVSFGAVPSGESLVLMFGIQSVTIGSAAGDLSGFSLGTVAANGSLHRHLGSFLNGSDGNNQPGDGVVPADGIYLIPLTLASSDLSIGSSAPLFVVYNNGLTEDQHDQAMSFVQTNIVPEPGSVALVGTLLLGLIRRRRRESHTAV